jgi:hydroxymethylbilane synthase
VAGLLRCETELLVVDTTGDRRTDQPVWEIGGQGVFVKEVQAAVLDGRADAAVHSAKDLPSETADGLVISAVPTRADARDVLVGARLNQLAAGAPIATGSVRRRAQLAWLRPDLTFLSLRGNIATRLDRIPPGGAIVMAAAALNRLGLQPEVVDVLEPSVMLPQVGQGSIAVECRAGDTDTIESLRPAGDAQALVALGAERGFLARLGGSCDLPVGAYATFTPDGHLHIDGLLASLDGRSVLRSGLSGSADDPASLGAALAEGLLGAGGQSLLHESGFAAL